MALAVACDDAGGVAEVTISLEADPNAVDFGTIAVNTTAAERPIEIRNTGTSPLEVDVSLDPEDPDRGAFGLDLGPTRIGPGQSTTLAVNFRPTELQAYEVEAVVRSVVRGSELRLPITLSGVGANPSVELVPSELSFGPVVTGTTKRLPLRVRNTSQAVATTLDVALGTNIDVCGPDTATAFCLVAPSAAFRDRPQLALGVGEELTLEFEFTPLVSGVIERGSLLLDACGSGIPDEGCQFDLPMVGRSVDSGLECRPGSIDFGVVAPGSDANRLVTCENIANRAVFISGWELETDSADFALGPIRPTVLPPAEPGQLGGTVDIAVTYEPLTLGSDLGFLVVRSDDPNPLRAELKVPLAGSGGGPRLAVLPSQINFGLCSDQAPCPRAVLLSNTGFQTLTISEVDVDIDATGAYSSTAEGSVNAITLEPGDSTEIVVVFEPPGVGDYASRMVLRSNDPDRPEIQVPLRGEGIRLPPCDYELSTTQLNFGIVETNQVGARPFSIKNRSLQDQCLVTSLRLDPSSDPEFSLPDGEVPSVLIEPGSSLGVRVEFVSNASGTFEGRAEFGISSPVSPFRRVDLAANAVDSGLLVVPRDVFFGTLELGCAARRRTVTVYNTGSTPTRIESVRLDGDPAIFPLVGLPRGALNLPPGANFSFEVGFVASAANPSDFAGSVLIEGTTGGQPVLYVVSLQGRGDRDAQQSDTFTQLGLAEVDVLFVVDNSCSMGDEQRSLATNFASFIGFAESQALDYHLAVTTTDLDVENGRFVPLANPTRRVVTPSTQPSPSAVFQQNVQLGTGGSGFEFAFLAAERALDPALLAGHNTGFLRRDAVLSLVFVTDEREQSPQSVDYYLGVFQAIKGSRSTELFTASSISRDGMCGLNSPRLRNIALRTGGVSAPICTTNWARTLEDLSQQAVGFRTRFFLANQPELTSVQVFVDGELIPATEQPSGRVNWTYDFSTNSINFNPISVPGPDSSIVVDYTPECIDT
jgi:hypothetical protein